MLDISELFNWLSRTRHPATLRYRRRRHLHVEALEDRTLLSGIAQPEITALEVTPMINENEFATLT